MDTRTERSQPCLRTRFDAATIFLHWTTVTLVAVQFATGFATASVNDTVALARLLLVHRSLGGCIFAVAILRLCWRRTLAYLPPFPSHMPNLQQWAATANEYALYALLFAQPLTGMGDTIFRGRPFAIFTWNIPALVPRLPAVYKALHAAHEFGAEVLAVLIGLHAAAALFHAVVLKDRVLHRMLPGREK